MTQPDLRVLVVDDTVLYRRVLSEAMAQIPGVTVVGTAAHGKIALAKLEQGPVDLVLLDVEMPVLGGLETLDAIHSMYPDTGVIMVSGANERAADITIQALARGALDFVPKPEGASPEESQSILAHQLRGVVQLFSTRKNLKQAKIMSGVLPVESKARHPGEKPASLAPKPSKKPPTRGEPSLRSAPRPARIDVIAVGVSTGGPNALVEVIPQLPPTLGVPVLVVQHMPPLFTRSLAENLAKKSQVAVREAIEGEPVQPNTVYVAPGGRHMVVRRNPSPTSAERACCIGLNDNPPENSCRPSVDVLFRSVAANYGGNTLAVIMTGMGSDGREGVKALKRQGCYCMTQSEDTCVVYGMPLAVDEAGLSDESVQLKELANRIATVVRNPIPKR